MKIGDSIQTREGFGQIVGTRTFQDKEFWVVDVPYVDGFPKRLFIPKI